MRVARILATAALSCLALGAGVTTAHADARPVPSGQPVLTVSPSPAVRGATATLTLRGGCSASTVSASSNAFTGSVTLTRTTSGTYQGTAVIRSSATAGTHTISVSCPNGTPSSFTFSVGTTTPSGGTTGGLGGSITDMDGTKVATGATW